jgi:hypothetical protein
MADYAAPDLIALPDHHLADGWRHHPDWVIACYNARVGVVLLA